MENIHQWQRKSQTYLFAQDFQENLEIRFAFVEMLNFLRAYHDQLSTTVQVCMETECLCLVQLFSFIRTQLSKYTFSQAVKCNFFALLERGACKEMKKKGQLHVVHPTFNIFHQNMVPMQIYAKAAIYCLILDSYII